MPEVTNELMYELLKKMNGRFDKVDTAIREVKAELGSIRGTMVSMQADLHNIYGVLARHDERLDRIENRLELRELAEAQAQFRRNE